MRIFPVLVGDADMPAQEELPTDLQPLAQRNAIELSEQSWDEDFNRLVAAIERSLGWSPAIGADVRLTGPGPATSAGHVAPEITARSADPPFYERTKSTRRVLLALAVVLLAGGLGFAAFRAGHLPWADPPASATDQPLSVPLPQSIGVESPSAKQQEAPAESSGRGSTPRLPRRPASTETVGRSRVTGGRPETTPAGSAADDQVSQRPSNSESSVAVHSRQSAGSTERPPQNPTVFLQCAGALEVCAALRTALDQALEKESLPGVRSLDRAEIVIAANVSVVDERVDRQFGTTFAVRTYSIDLTGEASRWRESVPMPAPKAVSFDARFGPDRLAQTAYVIAESAVEKVQAFWKKRVP